MRRSLLTLAIGAALFQPHAYANSTANVPAESRPADVAAVATGSAEVLQFVRLFSWAGVQLDPSHAMPFIAAPLAQAVQPVISFAYRVDQPGSADSQWLRWVRSHVRSE